MKIHNIQNYSIQSRQNQKPAPESIGFRGENNSDEERKSGFSAKKLTNVLGVLMWLTVVGVGMYKTGLFQKRSPENIKMKAKNIKAQFEDLAKGVGINEQKELEGKSKSAKSIYKLGRWANKMEKRLGSELYNNLTYAFGTLFVMPLVIWTSPFGKKDSTTSDKFYATIRQPFSVFSTLMLQLTFDKMFDTYLPKIIKSNRLESQKVKESVKDGKIGIEAFGDIKYNADETKRLFELLPDLEVEKGGLKGIITKEEAKSLVQLDKFADSKDAKSYTDLFDKLTAEGTPLRKKLSAAQFDTLKSRHKVVTDSIVYNKLAKQRPKVLNNVVMSSIIGCTFLNVIYGKTLKAFENKKEQKKLAKAQEVQNVNNR
jgi:hypothetical protein